jgi:hypothetical protein
MTFSGFYLIIPLTKYLHDFIPCTILFPVMDLAGPNVFIRVVVHETQLGKTKKMLKQETDDKETFMRDFILEK